MKSLSIVTLAACSLVAVSQGQVINRPPMRKAPTNEELILKLRASEQEMAAAAVAKPLSNATDPRAAQEPQDLISRSEILCYNGALTLIPKRAVLQYPQNLADRLKAQPGARVVGWPEFFAANRGWITTVEVSKVQAMGRQALSEDTATHITKCGKLVVATFNGNPISVHPVPAPEVPGSVPATQTTTKR